MPQPYDYRTQPVNVGGFFESIRQGRADRLATEEEGRQNALAKYLPGALRNEPGAREQSLAVGTPDQQIALFSQFSQLDDASKAREFATLQKTAQVLYGVKKSANPQMALEQAKPMLVQFGAKPEDIEAIDLDDIDGILASATSLEAQIERDFKERQFGLQERQFGESARHNRALEGAAFRRASGGGGGFGGGVGATAPVGGPTVGGQSSVPVPNPYAAMSSPAQRDQLYRQESRAHDKVANEARKAAATAQGIKAQFKQFLGLAERNQTGGWYGAPVIGGVVRGIASAVDSDIATMEALTAEIAPDKRPPGSGATSNYDAQQFERATVGVAKPNAANVNVATAAIAQADRDLEYVQFVDWYFRTHRTQQGMDEAWQEFVEANPIFDPNDPTNFGTNPNRASWKQWFGYGAGSSGQQGGVAPQSGGGAQSTPIVRNKAERDALPKGTIYIDAADGQRYRRE